MKRLLLILLLISGSVYGTRTPINSFPDTLTGTAADTFYLNTTDTFISVGPTAWRAIVIGSDYITVDLNNDTLFMQPKQADTLYDSCVGIYASGRTGFNIINGCVKMVGDSSMGFVRVMGIYLSAPDSSYLHDVTVLMTGRSPNLAGSGYADDKAFGLYGIYHGGGASSSMNRVVSCTVGVDCGGYYRRDLWPVEAFRNVATWNDDLITDTSTQYHVWYDSCNVPDAVHAGLYIEGASGTGYHWISNGHWIVDARNQYSFTGYWIGESYGIASSQAAALKIWNNTIEYDSTYGGGGGIFLESVRSSGEGFITDIYDNVIRASIGGFTYPGDGEDGHATGIRVRYGYIGIYIHDNMIYGYSDTISATRYRGGLTNGIWAGQDTESASADSLFLYNNTIFVSSAGGTALARCLAFATLPNGAITKSYNNSLTSNNRIIETCVDGGAGVYTNDYFSYQDTFYQGSAPVTFYSLYSGSWGGGAIGCYVLDGIFMSNTADTNIGFGSAGTDDWLIQRNINLTINDALSNAVQSAICTLKYDDGTVINIDTSDVSGLTSSVENTWYESRTATDSTGLQPFDIIVIAPDGSDTITVSNFAVIGRSGSIDTTLLFSTYTGTPTINRYILKGIKR